MKTDNIKYFALILAFAGISIILASCGAEGELLRSTGILADRDVISSIRQEIEDKENSSLAEPGDVFWTEGGALWHGSAECSYLASSKTVYHGDIEEAKSLGKERACDRCGTGGDSESIYDKIENNAVAKGDVFFTKGSPLWHLRDHCPLISNGDKIYHANRALALTLGKTDECEECKE